MSTSSDWSRHEETSRLWFTLTLISCTSGFNQLTLVGEMPDAVSHLLYMAVIKVNEALQHL